MGGAPGYTTARCCFHGVAYQSRMRNARVAGNACLVGCHLQQQCQLQAGLQQHTNSQVAQRAVFGDPVVL